MSTPTPSQLPAKLRDATSTYTQSSSVISSIFAYLSTLQVLDLRRVSQGWNTAGQMSSSFRFDDRDDTRVTLHQPVHCNLSGIRVIAIDAIQATTVKRRKLTDAEHAIVNNRLDDVLSLIAASQAASQPAALTALHLLASDAEFTSDVPKACSLASLCRHAFRHQLKYLKITITEEEHWSSLQSAEPFASLVSCTMHIANVDLVTPDGLAILSRLMPAVEQLDFSMSFSRLTSLQPLLQLPRLQRLRIHSSGDVLNSVDADSPLQLFGSMKPPSLQSLNISAPTRVCKLLVRDADHGLQFLGEKLQHLHLHDIEQYYNFATHLAQCHRLEHLELTAFWITFHNTTTYRQDLLTALTQLPSLRRLKLHYDGSSTNDEDGDPIPHGAERGYEEWTDEQFHALLRLPLQELWVQSNCFSADALNVFAEPNPPTLEVLRLGHFHINYQHLAVAAKLLKRLSISSVSEEFFGTEPINKRIGIQNLPHELQARLPMCLPDRSMSWDEYRRQYDALLLEQFAQHHPNVHFWTKWDDKM